MRLAFMLIASLLLGSCDGQTFYAVVPVCTQATEVRVSAGLRPEISWSPDCRVSELWVEEFVEPAPDIVPIEWDRYEDSPMIRPPVRVPKTRFTGSRYEPFSLVAGQRYRACLVDNETYPGYWAYLSCTEFVP
jgi:hypothetical protein